jgi:hypothetical protein
VRQERTAQHLENRVVKMEMVLLNDVIRDILRDCPPVKKEEPIGLEEIEHWFDTDSEAPVVLVSMPKEGKSFEEQPRIQISVNQHAVERELRARGIDENHPYWEMALRVVGPTLRDMTIEVLQDVARLMVAEGGKTGWMY